MSDTNSNGYRVLARFDDGRVAGIVPPIGFRPESLEDSHTTMKFWLSVLAGPGPAHRPGELGEALLPLVGGARMRVVTDEEAHAAHTTWVATRALAVLAG